jgi:hypothetical protein
MARNFATNPTAIWNDPRFRQLDPLEQHAYFLVSTQANITAAGTLPLTLRRWARLTAGGDVDQLLAALHGLARAGWAVIDEDTEELLLVPFVRDDKGYNNPKRRPAILEAAADVESPIIRRALAGEFVAVRLPTAGLIDDSGPPEPPSGVSPGDCLSDSQSTADSWDAADEPPEPPDEYGEPPEPPDPDTSAVDSAFSQVDRLSDSRFQKTAPSNGSRVTQGPYVSGIQDPHPSSSSAPRTLSRPARAVRELLGTDDDDSRWIADEVHRRYKPRNLAAYVRRMAQEGDLAALLAERHTAPSAGPPPPTLVDPPCGDCDPHRRIEDADGRLTRCPTCHPLREGAA